MESGAEGSGHMYVCNILNITICILSNFLFRELAKLEKKFDKMNTQAKLQMGLAIATHKHHCKS